MDDDLTALGIDALGTVDTLLADEADKVGHDFSAAQRAVAKYRDALAAVWRNTQARQDRDRLTRVNAVLSVVVGGHFPLGGVPWEHIGKARDQLAELVG